MKQTTKGPVQSFMIADPPYVQDYVLEYSLGTY